MKERGGREGKQRERRGEKFDQKTDSRVPPPSHFARSPFLPQKEKKAALHPSPHRVLARPLAGRLLVPSPVRLVDVRDLRDQRVVGVWVAQQRADRQEHFAERERGGPLLLEDVEADGPLGVDVRVVDLSRSFFFIIFWTREGEAEGGERRENVVENVGDVVVVGVVAKRKRTPCLCLELDFGGLERVVRREVDHDEEDSARVGRVRGAHDGRLVGGGGGGGFLKKRSKREFFFRFFSFFPFFHGQKIRNESTNFCTIIC